MQPPVTLVSFKVSSSSPEFQGVALGGEAPSISRCGDVRSEASRGSSIHCLFAGSNGFETRSRKNIWGNLK